MELKSYLQTVVCTRPCEVFALNMHNYERLIIRRNPRSQELLLASALAKLDQRVSRLPPAEDLVVLRLLVLKMQHKFNNFQPKKQSSHSSMLYSHTSEKCFHWDSIISQRGAIIDMYGPGTIYHRNKLRDKLMQKRIEANKLFDNGRHEHSSETKEGEVTSSTNPQKHDVNEQVNEKITENLEHRIFVWHNGAETNADNQQKPVSYVRLRRVQLDVSSQRFNYKIMVHVV